MFDWHPGVYVPDGIAETGQLNMQMQIKEIRCWDVRICWDEDGELSLSRSRKRWVSTSLPATNIQVAPKNDGFQWESLFQRGPLFSGAFAVGCRQGIRTFQTKRFQWVSTKLSSSLGVLWEKSHPKYP